VTFSIFVAHPSALLTDHRPHGDGLVAHGFIRGLAERGHTLHVAAQRVELREVLPPNVHLHVLGTGRLAEPLSRLEYMRKLRALYAQLKRTAELDLIHQLNPVDAGLTLALADAKEPVILGPYVPAWPDWSAPGSRALGTRLLDRVNAAVRGAQQRKATTVLLSTPAAETKLRARRGHLRAQVLSAGIDERVWSPGLDGPERQQILFLANLETRKGVFTLLTAFAQLATELPAAQLLLAGDGSQAAAIRRTVEQSPALRRVELLGNVPRDRVPEVMRGCSVYCLPALGEPFGMTALEAMACAKPVVVTEAGGLQYLVDDHGGRRVPVNEPAALAGALQEILTSPELQRQMGAHNRAVIEQRYTWTRVLGRLEAVYRDAVASARVR
jgi:glycosyltransferase involved in cell wall biosynthesis